MSSIDGFQGREADAVVLSTVRNNARGSLGFVTDPRRLNVAITRPRRALVVVGSPTTLSADGLWGDYLDYMVERTGRLVPAEEVAEAAREVWEQMREAESKAVPAAPAQAQAGYSGPPPSLTVADLSDQARPRRVSADRVRARQAAGSESPGGTGPASAGASAAPRPVRATRRRSAPPTEEPT